VDGSHFAFLAAMRYNRTMQSALDHIETRSGKCGGKPCIRGTRIRVQDVYVWHELRRMSPDEIVDQFPPVTLADVHAALAYFWDHQEEIRRQMREDEEFVAQLRAQSGPGLLDRIQVPRDPVSP
jgi:uncharacterized protein (DUF433 family)